MARNKSEAKKVLEKHGATIIDGYMLINNYGWVFELGGKKYDARFWANSYGCELNVWGVTSMNRREDDQRLYEPIDPDLKKELETELNS